MLTVPYYLLTAVLAGSMLLLALSPRSAGAGEAVSVDLAPQKLEAAVLAAASAAQSPPEAGAVGPSVPEPDAAAEAPVLTLDEALKRTLSAHPELARLEKEYWALDSAAWQAGRKPNPELELELDGFGGTAEARGFRSLAASLTYTQELERGGKRDKRETAAALEREVVLWDQAEVKHALQAELRLAFAAVQDGQHTLERLSEYRQLLQLIYDTVALQVEAGRSARLELERLDVELARLALDTAAAERSLSQRRQQLAGLWGGSAADFGALEPADPAQWQLPELAQLSPALGTHPALARLDAEYEALCALVDLEHANAVPDASVFGGLSRLNASEETVFKVGVAVELPFNDENEGAISAANYRLEQVEDQRAAVLRELTAQLTELELAAVAAKQHYQAYSTELLPAAREVLALMEEGYRYGKFALLDVLDAQRTVQELEQEQVQALAELHTALAGIEALLGTELDKLAEGGSTTVAAETTTDYAAAGQEPAVMHTPEEQQYDKH